MTASATMDNTMGALFVGIVCSTALLGAIFVQGWFYFNSYRRDPLYLKILVATIIVCSTANQALTSAGLYKYVITNFFSPTFLETLAPTIIIQNFFNVYTTTSVEIYFIYRIWKLTRGNTIVVIPLLVLTIAQCATSLAFTIRVLSLNNFLDIYGHAKAFSYGYNGVAVATNASITGVLCTVLLTSRNEFARTENVVDKAVSYVISTGLVTTAIVVGGLISYLVSPQSAIHICILFLSSRTHCISLLTSLNLRAQDAELDTKRSEPAPISFVMPNRSPSRPLQFVSGRTLGGRRDVDEMSEDEATMDKVTM